MFSLNNKPSKTASRIFFLFFFLLTCESFISAIFESRVVKIPVTEKNFADQFFLRDSLRPVIKKYEQIRVEGYPYLTNEKPSFMLSRISSSYLLIHFISVIICLILFAQFWNYDPSQPFRGRLSKSLRYIAFAILLYCLLNWGRISLLDSYVRHTTNGDYIFDELPGLSQNIMPLAFASLLLFFSRIVKEAEGLQKEQDLTI